MTYATYVDVLFCLYLIRTIPKDKLKAAFLSRMNVSTRGELNFYEGEPVQRSEPKKMETGTGKST